MTKRSLQTCQCGKPMEFPDGQVKTTCPCGQVWEMDCGGYWFTNLVIPFATPKARFTPEKRKNYPKSNKRRRGNKC